MPMQRTPDPRIPSSQKPERKAWKKKTPFEIVLEQGEKLKAEIAEIEKDLAAKRRQLQKFDEARKLFES